MYTLYRYSLPINLPDMHMREGFLLHINERWTEASPLPGFSTETLSQVELDFPNTASGRYALECATLPLSTKPVPVNALLMGDNLLAKAHAAYAEGFTHAKVKIAELEMEEAIALANTLREMFSLRIDLNRKWPLAKTLYFLSHFPKNVFDYIEEPVDNYDDLTDFSHPFALDETAREYSLPPNLKALIIKPMISGGIAKTEEIAALAQKNGWQLILSSSFETGVGLNYLASLAHHLNLTDTPIGLDTYRYFSYDILENPLTYKNGMMYPPSKIEINTSLLCTAVP